MSTRLIRVALRRNRTGATNVKLVLPFVDSRAFVHNAAAKTISADASDLRVPFGRMYDDACDVAEFKRLQAKFGAK